LRASIPTPAQSVLELGPLTIHYYALCIITGIALAIWLGHTRFKIKTAQGQSVVSEVSIVAVPSGIIGGRIYHVISSPNAYFGSGGAPLDAFKIWEGGLGIWGAISIGLLGAYLRYRSLARTMELPSFAVFADALAPGILLAQAIGRFGNWFNGELFGRPLDTWWALEIPARYRPSGYSQFETFHPTFLYEAIWCAVIAFVILKFGKPLKAGQSFALYVAAYCLGRFFIELIRIDSANTIAGLRVNLWVSVAVGAGAALYFARASKRIE
jgi:prolipoprotein diacylglyceryl transferase